MYIILLLESDLISEAHFPVIALINEAFNTDAIEFLNNLANNIGSGYNYTNCTFWDDLDDYEKSITPQLDGIMINTEDNEVIVVSLKTMVYYLEITCARLTDTGYASARELNNALECVRSKNKGKH